MLTVFRIEHPEQKKGPFRYKLDNGDSICWASHSIIDRMNANHSEKMLTLAYEFRNKLEIENSEDYCCAYTIDSIGSFMDKEIINYLISEFNFKVYKLNLSHGIYAINQVFFKDHFILDKEDITSNYENFFSIQ